MYGKSTSATNEIGVVVPSMSNTTVLILCPWIKFICESKFVNRVTYIDLNKKYLYYPIG